MFRVEEDLTIHLTRGDIAAFDIKVNTTAGIAYKFKTGDVIRLKVFKKKGVKEVLLQKDVLIEEDAYICTLMLSKEETKIGEPITKPTDYWYEVEYNPDTAVQTVIGYDEDGPKVFKLYPEGGDYSE